MQTLHSVAALFVDDTVLVANKQNWQLCLGLHSHKQEVTKGQTQRLHTTRIEAANAATNIYKLNSNIVTKQHRLNCG